MCALRIFFAIFALIGMSQDVIASSKTARYSTTTCQKGCTVDNCKNRATMASCLMNCPFSQIRNCAKANRSLVDDICINEIKAKPTKLGAGNCVSAGAAPASYYGAILDKTKVSNSAVVPPRPTPATRPARSSSVPAAVGTASPSAAGASAKRAAFSTPRPSVVPPRALPNRPRSNSDIYEASRARGAAKRAKLDAWTGKRKAALRRGRDNFRRGVAATRTKARSFGQRIRSKMHRTGDRLRASAGRTRDRWRGFWDGYKSRGYRRDLEEHGPGAGPEYKTRRPSFAPAPEYRTRRSRSAPPPMRRASSDRLGPLRSVERRRSLSIGAPDERRAPNRRRPMDIEDDYPPYFDELEDGYDADMDDDMPFDAEDMYGGPEDDFSDPGPGMGGGFPRRPIDRPRGYYDERGQGESARDPRSMPEYERWMEEDVIRARFDERGGIRDFDDPMDIDDYPPRFDDFEDDLYEPGPGMGRGFPDRPLDGPRGVYDKFGPEGDLHDEGPVFDDMRF